MFCVCESHGGIGLVIIISKMIAGIILRGPSGAGERFMLDNRAGFRRGRGFVDQIFTLRQILGYRNLV